MRFIGITGGVGAGKSEILSYISRHYKCEIYLADEVAKEVQRAGTDCFRRLTELLGADAINACGELDRTVVAEKIFSDNELLWRVNDIVHPAVKEYLLEKYRLARSNPQVELFFVEAALLIETGYREVVDEMWYIYASEAVRTDRLQAGRGYGAEKIKKIMKHQLPEETFRENCDFVIDNSGSLQSSYQQIDKKLEAFTWRD